MSSEFQIKLEMVIGELLAEIDEVIQGDHTPFPDDLAENMKKAAVAVFDQNDGSYKWLKKEGYLNVK